VGIEVELTDRIPAPPRVIPLLTSKHSQEQAERAEEMVFTILNGLVGTAFGEEARCPEEAEEFIHGPAARMIAKMDPATSALMEKWTDPIFLMMGISIWGLHIWQVMGDDDDDNRRPEPEPEPTPSPARSRRSNGRKLTPEEAATGSPPVSILERTGALEPADVPQE
jgi:hypothetical protein